MELVQCRKLVLAVLGASAVLVADAMNFYVSTSGNDANDGSAPDAAHALLTVEAGVAKARDYIVANPDDTATVNVGAGTFALATGLRLHARTSLKGAGRNETVLDMTALRNLTAPGGAAIALTNALSFVQSLTVTNGIAKSKVATENVRCVTVSDGTLSDCRLTGGCLGGANFKRGAGFSIASGVVTNCVVDHCSVESIYNYGGGCNIAGGLVVDCEFYANMGPDQYYGNGGGGAVCLTKGTLRRCSIHDNGSTSRAQGGAIQVSGWDSKLIENCLVFRNVAKSGLSAVYSSGSAMTMRYCTIYGNPPSNTACVRLEKGTGASFSFQNNIVWGNASETYADVLISADATLSATQFCSNLLTRAISGYETRNFTGDPLFMDADNGDFHLGARASSAAYGRALPIATVTTDYALKPRDAVSPCIGAYEYDSSAVVLKLNVTINAPECLPGQASAYAGVSGAEIGEYEVEWFVDGASVGKGLEMTFPTTAYGVHDVKATVTTTEEPPRTKSVEVKNAFTIRTDVAYVNNTGSGTYPYATPATATNDLNEAIAAVWTSVADPRVMVEAGTYSMKDPVSLTIPMRIVGTGADLVEFVCDRPTFVTSLTINHAQAKVSGIKLSNHGTQLVDKKRDDGRAVDLTAGELSNCIISNFVSNHFNFQANVRVAGGKMFDCEVVGCQLNENYCKGGGIYVDSSGLVSNCTVRGCACIKYWNNERGGGIYVKNGTVVNTRITACARSDWNQDGALAMEGGTVRGCVIEACKAKNVNSPVVRVDGGTFESCTVAANTNGNAAVGVTAGTVRNTVVYGNDTTAQVSKSGGTVTYCCYAEADETDGNHNRKPAGRMFRSLSRGDYCLLGSSPCLDAGLYRSWMAGARDINGQDRILRGAVDIGACESVVRGLRLLFK